MAHIGEAIVMQICPVCIVEMRHAKTLPCDFSKVDADACQSPIHSMLLVSPKTCVICGTNIRRKAHNSTTIYCSTKCAATGRADERLAKKFGSSPSGLSSSRCVFCHSTNVVKNGVRRNVRRNTSNNVQRLLCRCCGRGFSLNKRRTEEHAEVVKLAVRLRLGGKSLRAIAKQMGEVGIKVSYMTIYNWTKKVDIPRS